MKTPPESGGVWGFVRVGREAGSGLLSLESRGEAALAAGGLILVDDALLCGAVDDGNALGESGGSVTLGAVGDLVEELLHRLAHQAETPAVAGAVLFVLTDAFTRGR